MLSEDVLRRDTGDRLIINDGGIINKPRRSFACQEVGGLAQ